MKKSIYDTLEQIPQADRDENNYQQCNDAGSPNNGKWVLLLDGAHPVQMKNTELLSEKAGTLKKNEHDSIVLQKDTEISRLNTELQIAKTQGALPAGQVAVAASDLELLNKFKQLGEFDGVKTKVDEHTTLKEKDEAVTRKTLFTDAAQAHGLNPDAFVALAEQQKLHERLESRDVPDPKDANKKITHFFVKGKDSASAETSTVLGDFVKEDAVFKPFLASLTASAEKQPVRTPNQSHGEPPKETSAAKAYVSQIYGKKKE